MMEDEETMERLEEARLAAMHLPQPHRDFELNVLAEEGRTFIAARGAKQAHQFLLQAEEHKTQLDLETSNEPDLQGGNPLDSVLDRVAPEPESANIQEPEADHEASGTQEAGAPPEHSAQNDQQPHDGQDDRQEEQQEPPGGDPVW